MNLLRSRCLAVLPQVDFSVFPPKGGKERRLSGFLRPAAMLTALCLGSAGAWAATCTVNSTADTNTSGTLRNCLNNLDTGIPASTNTVTITATGKIRLTSSLPDIENGVTITGPGANQLDISGAGTYQVFTMGSSASPQVAISGLSMSGGKVSGSGGAIAQSGGSLTVSGCQFAANTSSANGGAIYAVGSLTVENSTFTGNSSANGGHIYASGGLTLTNSTFSGNTASGPNGGAVFAAGTIAITNNTFYGNSISSGQGNAIAVNGTAETINNNLFVNNIGGATINDVANVANASNNVFFGNSGADCQNCATNSSAFDATANPLSAPLTYYGGTTQTLLPQPGSQAICKGSASLASTAGLTTDQRGFAMDPATYTPCAAGSVDAGAVQANYIQVQTGTDAGTGASDCENPTPSGCTLRDALALANSNTPGGYGDIDFGVSSVNLSGSTLLLSGTAGINIIGPGATTVTVKGGNFSVFTVNANVPALLYGLTISNGNTSTNGGGINNAGTLTVVDSTITSNTAVNGGGIANAGTLQIAESTIAGNSAASGSSSAYGGGIYSSGLLSVINSTIAGNSASGNPTDDGGGIDVAGGSATLANTVVSANTNATDNHADIDSGTFTDGGGNIIGGSTNATSNLAGGAGAPILPVTGGGAPVLQLNGIGATIQTIMPLPGSPAICAGAIATIRSGVTLSSLSTDERGYPLQPAGGYCTPGEIDAGAVQTNYTSVNFVQQPSTVALGSAISPAPTVNVIETDTLLGSSNTDAVNGIPITLTYSGAGTLSGNSATTTGGVATFGSLEVSNTPGMNVTLGASVPVVGTTTLSATSSSFNVIGPATRLLVSAPVSTTVGVPFSVTVTAYDAANDIATGYAGTVKFTSTDPSTAVILPGIYTFVPATDNGVHVFTNGVTLVTTPSQTVTATDTVTNTITGFATVTVSPASTSVTQPASLPVSPTVDQQITLSSTVSVTAPGVYFSSTPYSANVNFVVKNGGTTVATCSGLPNATTGVAQCTILSSLAAGTYGVTAQYSGDTEYLQSAVSSAYSMTVGKVATTVSVGANPTSQTVDGSVTLTATVTPTPASLAVAAASNTTVNGTVTFTDTTTSTTLCSSAAFTMHANGTATASCSTTALTVPGNPNNISVTYTGDANNITSSSTTPATVTMSQATPTFTSLVPSVTTASLGSTVTFTATITAPGNSVLLGGSVTFLDNGSPASCTGGNVIPISTTSGSAVGTAVCSTNSMPATTHVITATYGTDPNYSGVGPAIANTVTVQTNTAGTVGLTLSPAGSSTIDQPVTITLTVAHPASTALNGTPTLTDNGLAVAGCTLSAISPTNTASGTSTCITSSLAQGSHSFVAMYSDSNGNDPANGTAGYTVSKETTNLTVSSLPSGSTVNQSVTFTAKISFPYSGSFPGGFTPSGSISFTDSVTSAAIPGCAGTLSLVNPTTYQAQCTIASLAVSGHTITASYSGDANFGSSSGTTNITVQPASSSVALTSSLNPSTFSQQITFTATVTPFNATIPLSSLGTVEFQSNSVDISGCSAQPITPATGIATCQTSTLAVGANITIKAIYASDPSYLTSFGTLLQTVNPVTEPPLALTASSPLVVDTPVTFTATFSTPSAPLANGIITFTDQTNSKILCTQPVSLLTTGSGASTWQATCSSSNLTAGPHVIQAAYSGDSHYAVASNTISVTINPAASTTTLVSNQNPSFSATGNTKSYEDTVTFTATVSTPAGAAIPLSVGTVTISGNGLPPSCSAIPVIAGLAQCTAPALPDGSDSITATYSGDPNYTNSTSSAVPQVVEDYAVTVVPTSPAYVFVAQGYASGSTSGYQGGTTTASVDPFSAQNITLTPASLGTYAGKPGLSCTAQPSTGAPACDLAATTMTITNGATQSSVGVVIDASGSAVVPGIYVYTVTATDSVTSIVRTATFKVVVYNVSSPLPVVSGATSNNSGNVTFQLPAGVQITSLSCPYIFGTGLTVKQKASSLGIVCTFNPTTVGSLTSTSAQSVTVQVTVTTSGTVTAQNSPSGMGKSSSLLVAALFGLPVLVLMGFRRSRRSFLANITRALVIVALTMGAFYSIGCAGNPLTSSSNQTQSGTTPPGAYNLLIQGTGNDGNTYQAVLSLDVNL